MSAKAGGGFPQLPPRRRARPCGGGARRPQGWAFRGEVKTTGRQPAACRGGPGFGPVPWGLK